MKTIRDAIHGDMRFSGREMAVIDTAPLQRLRGIKQLGASCLVFPSAVHSRFEHTLGTCWIAKRLAAALQERGHEITEEHRETVALSALLHDVTHVPFSHTFEDERRLFDRHDEDPGRLDYFLSHPQLAPALRPFGGGDAVRRTLLGEAGTPAFVRDLVTGTVCADLLDYLKRDAFHCGLALDYDDRLYHYFELNDDRLVVRLHKAGGFRRDALSELVHLLQIRYSLTERVYYHHAKVVAGAMVSRALELALEAGAFKRAQLYSLRDDSLLYELWLIRDKVAGVADVLEDLDRRRLYQRVYLLTLEGLSRPGISNSQRDQLSLLFHSDVQHRRSVEQQIADRLGVPAAHVIIYCPSPKMQLKEADVPVEVAEGEVRPLASLGHPDVDALKEKHRGLWRFYVLLRRQDCELAGRASEICEELIGYRNQLGSQKAGRLAFP